MRKKGYSAKLSQPSGARGPRWITVAAQSMACEMAATTAVQPNHVGKARWRSDTTPTATSMTEAAGWRW